MSADVRLRSPRFMSAYGVGNALQSAALDIYPGFCLRPDLGNSLTLKAEVRPDSAATATERGLWVHLAWRTAAWMDDVLR